MRVDGKTAVAAAAVQKAPLGRSSLGSRDGFQDRIKQRRGRFLDRAFRDEPLEQVLCFDLFRTIAEGRPVQ